MSSWGAHRMLHDPNDREWVKAFYDSAVVWWGDSWYEGENLAPRLALVEAFAGPGPKRILELAAGPGETVGYFAAAGHEILAVDIAPGNARILRSIAARNPKVRALEGDFMTVDIREKFEVVCIFESFGFGTDAEQRALLRRIASWIGEGGCAIVGVYHPYWPMRAAGSAKELDRLEGVPGSVDMTEYTRYDALHGRWIDTWEPRSDKAAARSQSIRLYTPADFALLLEGTGLRVAEARVAGKVFDFFADAVEAESPLLDHPDEYDYAVKLVPAP
jgi:SAM-dependent methyltransferase